MHAYVSTQRRLIKRPGNFYREKQMSSARSSRAYYAPFPLSTETLIALIFTVAVGGRSSCPVCLFFVKRAIHTTCDQANSWFTCKARDKKNYFRCALIGEEIFQRVQYCLMALPIFYLHEIILILQKSPILQTDPLRQKKLDYNFKRLFKLIKMILSLILIVLTAAPISVSAAPSLPFSSCTRSAYDPLFSCAFLFVFTVYGLEHPAY